MLDENLENDALTGKAATEEIRVSDGGDLEDEIEAVVSVRRIVSGGLWMSFGRTVGAFSGFLLSALFSKSPCN